MNKTKFFFISNLIIESTEVKFFLVVEGAIYVAGRKEEKEKKLKGVVSVVHAGGFGNKKHTDI